MQALWAIGWYLFLKITASQTNQLLFRNWAGHVTNSARTGDDKDCGSLLCCEKPCNTAMLCPRTSASFQLRRARFGQVYWIFFIPGTGTETTKLLLDLGPILLQKASSRSKGAFPLVYTTIYFNNLIILFIRHSKMYLIYPVLPM